MLDLCVPRAVLSETQQRGFSLAEETWGRLFSTVPFKASVLRNGLSSFLIIACMSKKSTCILMHKGHFGVRCDAHACNPSS